MKTFRANFDDVSTLGAKRSVALEVEDAAVDFNGRRRPKLMAAPRDRVSKLENTVAKLSAELVLRCTQLADLCNVRQQQANDLINACDEIDRLSKSINALQNTITQLENGAATRENKLMQLDKENISLRLQLDNSLKESTAVLQRLLSVETAFNDRELAIVSTQERYAQIKVALTAAQAETFRLSASAEEANQRHGNDLNQQGAQFKDQIRKFECAAVEQNRQLKYLEESRAKLASRCDDLSKVVVTLESEKANAQKKYESQAVAVLETILRVERESAERKINELTAELQHERVERLNSERTSAGIRKDIVILLPKLAALQSRATSSELDPFVSENSAA